MIAGEKANKHQVRKMTRTKHEAVSITVSLPMAHTCHAVLVTHFEKDAE